MAKLLDRLYATDYYAWTREQAAALRRLAASRADLPLDLDHLAEEVAGLGKSERRAARSQMRRLLEHLLKLHSSTQGTVLSSRTGGTGRAGARRPVGVGGPLHLRLAMTDLVVGVGRGKVGRGGNSCWLRWEPAPKALA